MAVWFSKSKLGSISPVYKFSENGKEPAKSTLSIQAKICKIVETDDFFTIVTTAATKCTGYAIMNDKKGDQPANWDGSAVMVNIQKNPKRSQTFNDKTEEIEQTKVHAIVSSYLSKLEKSDYYELNTLMLTHEDSLLSHVEVFLTDTEPSVEQGIYMGMICKLTPLTEDALMTSAIVAALPSLEALAKEVETAKPYTSGGGSKYPPKETQEQILATRKAFFLAECESKEGTIAASFQGMGLTYVEVAQIVLKVMES